MNHLRKTRQPSLAQRRFFWPVLGVIVLLVVFGLLESFGVTHVFHKSKPANATVSAPDTAGGASQNNQKGQPQSGSSSDSSGASAVTTQPNITKSNAGGNSAANLLAPSGNFVSNHHPNLSGSPAPNLITSTCTTTPGAICQITFTDNGVTKSLPAETTDGNGSAYWSWHLQDYGLTAGSWQIQAAVSLDGQTKTANDPMSLEVAQ